MKNLKVGDIVSRRSYNSDILFKVVDIKDNVVVLKGICYRIEADAPLSDIVVQSETGVNNYRSQVDSIISKKVENLNYWQRRKLGLKNSYLRSTPKENTGFFYKSGKVLHLDGDSEYLQKCLDQYKSFGIDVVGKYIPEKDQPYAISILLKEHTPDILILTGHDGILKSEKYLDVNSYRNSKYFIASVKEARKFDNNLDSLIIFAGACQSMYKEIINAGANFASAPQRVLIHALDPVFIANKLAFSNTSILVSPKDVINATLTGTKGIGGVQSRGKLREGYPDESYKS